MKSGSMVVDEAIANITALYPRLYHMAAEGSWPSIQRHGLLSTSALLDLYEVCDPQRTTIEAAHRPAAVRIEHPAHGRATIRDQIPLSDRGLERALQDGLTLTDWYRLLNERVFFWLTEDRLERMLRAAAYRNYEHDVLTLNSEPLIHDHAAEIELSPMNTGCTKPYPHPRGKDTFQPLDIYPLAARKKSHRADAVVELAAMRSVPNVADYVIEVRRRSHGKQGRVIWRRDADGSQP